MSELVAPMAYRWDGEAMVPLPRFAREADAVFVIGEVYRLEVHEERTAASHRQYFACVAEAWNNLPEEMGPRFPTPEHLRKFALIKTGFANSRQLVASSKAEAMRLAAFLEPVDTYAIVTVDGAVVTQWTAQSQSTRAMGKATFEASKRAVLDYLAGLVEASPAALAENVRRVA